MVLHAHPLESQWNYAFVVHSILVAIMAAYLSLDFVERSRDASPRAKAFWLSIGALTMGLGIWIMHFIGMIAMTLPVPVAYDLPMSLGSVLFAIAGSSVAFWMVGRKKTGVIREVLGIFFMGAAISSMHYLGMASMSMAAVIRYNTPVFIASLMIAWLTSGVALWVFRRQQEIAGRLKMPAKIITAIVMGFAIAGMHYTGMAAAHYVPSATHMHTAMALDITNLTLVIMTLVMVLCVGFVVLSSHIERERNQALASLQKANTILESGIAERTEELQESNQKLLQELIERQQLEKQLLEAQKMESIGQLTAGVAHEINNPIGFVSSNLSTLTEYMETFKKICLVSQDLMDASTREVLPREAEHAVELLKRIYSQDNVAFILDDVDGLLTESKDGVQRVKSIVHGMKALTRKQSENFQLVNVNECIRNTISLVWSQLKFKCKLHTEYGNLPMVMGHEGSLGQVFINLLMNASQAIPLSGNIYIRTEATDNEVSISISDDGQGIPEEHLTQIFNPFFTTKSSWQGTGLGLTIVYSIIERHNGRILVDSKPGMGATFTINLPTLGASEDAPSIISTSGVTA